MNGFILYNSTKQISPKMAILCHPSCFPIATPAPAKAETGHSKQQWQRRRHSAVGRSPRGMPLRNRPVLSAWKLENGAMDFVFLGRFEANPMVFLSLIFTWTILIHVYFWVPVPGSIFQSNQFWDGGWNWNAQQPNRFGRSVELTRFRGSLHTQLAKNHTYFTLQLCRKHTFSDFL